MSELKPCPFCGGIANTLHKPHVIDMRYSVGCNDDECLGFIGLSWLYKTEAEAIAAWNTRAERTCHIEGRYGNQYCTCCGEMVGTWDSTSELYIDGNMVELWNYCPNCGAKVVS